jgi:hypothetical protein
LEGRKPKDEGRIQTLRDTGSGGVGLEATAFESS